MNGMGFQSNRHNGLFVTDIGYSRWFHSSSLEIASMNDPHSQYNVVEKLIDDEKFQEAIVGLKKILDDDDSFVLAHLALARVFTKTGQHAEAIGHGQRACELEPDDPFNYTAMSVTYQRAWAGTQDHQYIAKAEEAMARAQQLQGR